MGSIQKTITPFRFLIVGGSYGGLATALNLLDLCNGRAPRMAYEASKLHPEIKNIPIDITIVDERDGFLHLIGSPLIFASPEYASKAWVKFSDIPALSRPNVSFVQGTLDKVNTASKTATVLLHMTKAPQELSYDFMITATGLRRPFPVVPQSLLKKQYLAEVNEQVKAVSEAPDGVVIVGGGAVGIEMAAELKLVSPHVKVTLVHSREKLLSSEGLSDECKDKALELVKEANVDVLINHRVAESRKVSADDGSTRTRYEVEFTNGHKLVASEVIMAISHPTPTTSFMPPSSRDAEGLIKIQPTLFLEPSEGVHNADSHLAVGDAVKWSGIKRCGGAMHQGHFAAYNMHQRMLAILTSGRADAHVPAFKELAFVPPMIGLAVGKKAVAYGPEVGVSSGEDVMQAYFRDDLGFSIVWDYMQLGKTAPEEVVSEPPVEKPTVTESVVEVSAQA